MTLPPIRSRARICLALAVATLCQLARADVPEIRLVIRNHLFEPAELIVPANTKIKLIVVNEDATPEEFESYELNREKIVLGNSSTVVFIGPLAPGSYSFFGEFNISTAQGKLIAR